MYQFFKKILTKNQVTRILREVGILTFSITVALTILMVTGCSSFRDEETPQPPVVVGEPSPAPGPIQEPRPQVTKENANQLCQDERQWAYLSGQIDANLLRLYVRRNFSPIYTTPGERQSGIDSWALCEQALRANGFLKEKTENTMDSGSPATPSLMLVADIFGGDRAPVVKPTVEKPPRKPQPETYEMMLWRLCDAERLHAYGHYRIDAIQLRLYRRRNLAPLYEIPGDHDSYIEGWAPCERALEINGVLQEKDYSGIY